MRSDFSPAILLCVLLAVFSFSPEAFPANIVGPEIFIENNNIMVDTGLSNTGDIEKTISQGIEKEIVYTLELFRVTKFWPDQFVVAKKLQKTTKYDHLRKQFATSLYDGSTRHVRSFRDVHKMRSWIFNTRMVNVANVKELDPGSYYVRVVVESKSKELPPVIGLMMIFIPEVEMTLAKESKSFKIGTGE